MLLLIVLTNKILKQLENRLIKTAKGDEFHDVLSLNRKDFDDNRFRVQLETLSEYRKEFGVISVCTIAEFLKNLKVRSYLTEVSKLNI